MCKHSFAEMFFSKQEHASLSMENVLLGENNIFILFFIYSDIIFTLITRLKIYHHFIFIIAQQHHIDISILAVCRMFVT